MGQFAQPTAGVRSRVDSASRRLLAPHDVAFVTWLALALTASVSAQSPRPGGRQLPEIYFRPPTRAYARTGSAAQPPDANNPWRLPPQASAAIRQPEFIMPAVVAASVPGEVADDVAQTADGAPASATTDSPAKVANATPPPADLARHESEAAAVDIPAADVTVTDRKDIRLASLAPVDSLQEPARLDGALHLEEAEQLAASAATHDKFTEVIELCERSLRAGLEREADTLARRLGAWAYNRRGEALAASDESAALLDFQQAIQLDANCWQAIHNRAISYAMSGQLALAMIDFNRVLKLNPDAASAYRNRGELFATMGRTGAAVDDYSQAIERLPDDAVLYNMRGHAYHRLGEFRAAVADLNQSIRLAERNPVAYTNRGNLYAELGYYRQALRDFETAIEQDAAWWPALRGIAWTLATAADENVRDAERSVAMAQQARERSPAEEPLVLDTLAAALASAGRFSEAADFQLAAMTNVAPAVKRDMEQRLELYRSQRPFLSRPRALPTREPLDPGQPDGPALR